MTRSSFRSPRRRREHTVRFGNYEARKRGVRRIDLRDPYRLVVALTWPRFLGALFGVELVLNLAFALLYLARPGSIANARPGSLADAFFFSLETLATVGYGEMYPADFYGHLVSALEIVTGVAFVAAVTGLIFVRMSRPQPCFRYPEQAVITPFAGRPTLMIRVANDRLGVLYDASARLSVLVPERTAEGHVFRNIVMLPLVRAEIPVFALSWTLMHVIDEASPLHGLDEAGLKGSELVFFLMLRAEDATLAATVRDLRAYRPTDFRLGARYVDALSVGADGRPVLDLDRVGAIEPAASGPAG